MKSSLLTTLCVTLALLAGAHTRAETIGTTFTYQGRLFDSGEPANGTYDLRFELYDADTGGTQQGSTLEGTVNANEGIFTIILDFEPEVFDGGDRWMEISVRPGGTGDPFITLGFRQPLTPSPYAIAAGKVTGPIDGGAIIAGTVTGTQLASGAVTATHIASNTITASQLATGTAAANLAASGQAPVPSGGIVLSADDNDANLAALGYVKIGKTEIEDFWEQGADGPGLASQAPPSPRAYHTAVWTGSEMVVWGGSGGSYQNDGRRYDPVADSWTTMTTTGAPIARAHHTAIWTGTELIVWGGGGGYRNDGGRYDPVADTWTATSITGAPAGRAFHTAVWTGSEMVVWGGSHYDGANHYFHDGGRYDPATDSWSAVSTTSAPVARNQHTAVWTGSEMIVWGGFYYDGSYHYLHDGGRYDPAADLWAPVTITGAPTGRQYHTALWNGNEMIVWGGRSGPYLNDGGRYDPVADSWTALSTTGAPTHRGYHTVVWTGDEMIVWGGYRGTFPSDGGRYDPETDSWTAVGTTSAPAPRRYHSTVWTGGEMIVWGGNYYDGSHHYFDDGGRYDPISDSWIPTRSRVYAGRSSHTAVWTGGEMIVWGGYHYDGSANYLNDGGLYDPTANSWTAVTTIGAPVGRSSHTTVWTGQEMIVWGGYRNDGSSVYLNDGGRYDPLADSWVATNITGAPAPRNAHTSVWTGTEMIVWGGNGGGNRNDGARYDPLADSWVAVNPAGAPTERRSHTAVWTGSDMIVWGGQGSTYLNDGARYDPVEDNWVAVGSAGAPPGRRGHTAVWTGTEMIVWGGYGGGYRYDGGRFDPASDSWKSFIHPSGSYAARERHTAVWTGSRMLVWGGYNGTYSSHKSDGFLYEPATFRLWGMGPSGAPAARAAHTAVWTGTEMIIWGGNDSSSYHSSTFAYSPEQVLHLYKKQ